MPDPLVRAETDGQGDSDDRNVGVAVVHDSQARRNESDHRQHHSDEPQPADQENRTATRLEDGGGRHPAEKEQRDGDLPSAPRG